MKQRILRYVFIGLLWFLGITIGMVVLYKYVPVYYTPLMAIRSNESTLDSFETKHQWVPLSKISKHIQLAVICSEDQKFVKHNGFDVGAIKRAYTSNRKGKKIRGGSTISQQTAKNVFLWPQRSWLRKGLETYFTFLIEKIWGKERILEVYLNSIEMGNGVYGVEMASKYWFKTSAIKLTKSQAALIAATLPNPRVYKANPVSLYMAKRKHWILKQMQFYGTLVFPVKKNKDER